MHARTNTRTHTHTFLTLQAAEDELAQERDCVSHLIGRDGGSCAIGPNTPDTTVPGEN